MRPGHTRCEKEGDEGAPDTWRMHSCLQAEIHLGEASSPRRGKRKHAPHSQRNIAMLLARHGIHLIL